MNAIKMLLAVRISIPNDICLIEVGYPSLEAVIRQRHRKFISRMKKERENMFDQSDTQPIVATSEETFNVL